MAAAKNKTPKQGRAKKTLRGKMPTKRTINLVLVDENKIRLTTAIPAVILIILLAVLFSKYLVADRLVAMSTSAAKASRLQNDLNAAMEAVNGYGDVETTYAHYTCQGMSAMELSLVDRTQVLELVGNMLPKDASRENMQRFLKLMIALLRSYPGSELETITLDELAARVVALLREYFPPRYEITTWSVTSNLLTIEVTGNTLRTLNNLARELEHSPIVDSCSIITANRDKQENVGGMVRARLIVYLQQAPAEEVSAP